MCSVRFWCCSRGRPRAGWCCRSTSLGRQAKAWGCTTTPAGKLDKMAAPTGVTSLPTRPTRAGEAGSRTNTMPRESKISPGPEVTSRWQAEVKTSLGSVKATATSTCRPRTRWPWSWRATLSRRWRPWVCWWPAASPGVCGGTSSGKTRGASSEATKAGRYVNQTDSS